ncbi:radical SAM protein [Psychromarinibacter sp. C21-152]|uniref:Radical SAM protein n=1 Tax=Psychromarinibacter sediminicola TaxID=3033385 RepID=A0AAE3NRB1_9RHOB|nr:radical SAM protein [Psychromarinibacter sediminicola]MDF0602838.1 radical SAM protein [Psychromarinibacter sediminicola]
MPKRKFHFVMIKPSHYDEDGYVIQFYRSAMPSNTLATIYGLAEACRDRRVLGDDVEIAFTAIDETNRPVRVDRIVRQIRADGGMGLIGLIGVQTNQYPRALDLARRFREAGLQVCIGGFHVSGCLAMLPGVTPELQEALDMGVSLFSGEAEGRLDIVLQDAFRGEMRPVYDYMNDLPALQNAPRPFLNIEAVKRTGGAQASFDAGRGCPYLCSFCTIINVQGRTSRHRSADDVVDIIKANLDQGIVRFFITDDNFARNSSWEPILDALIAFRERDGRKFNLTLQVDTACHRLPGFIEKAAQAGCKRVFIGLENINPESLKGAQKGQNQIVEYRQMLQAWRAQRVITTAGYILGFPGDTPETIRRDIEIIKRELPIDILEFFYLTPLPGSADHKALLEKGVEMDPDLNKYDLNNICTAHDTMTREDWQRAYRLAWDTYFSEDHCETLLRRARADGLPLGKIVGTMTWFYGSVLYEGVHPLESGFFRRKSRTDRRPGFPVESPLVFYPKYGWELVSKTYKTLRMFYRYRAIRKRLEADESTLDYTDASLTPVTDAELAEMDLYRATDAARQAAARAQRKSARRQEAVAAKA